jgi:glucose-1-phosphate adenylyltransferase
VLSNLVNAGMLKIAVLTQYKSHSLDRHISLTWRMSTLLGNYVTPVPAQQRLGPRWYQGSADAIFQSLNLINDDRPDYIVVFGADNIYRMDVSQMLDAHIAGGFGCSVAGIRVPRSQASAFGVIDAGEDAKIDAFLEKPADPPGLVDDPDSSFASMGNYIFSTNALIDALHADAEIEISRHDMGGDIIPASWSGARPRSTTSPPTRYRAPPTGTGRTGGTSGRSTPTTRPTWTWSRSTRCSTSTTRTGRSGPTRCRCQGPSSPWTAGPPTP